MEFLIFWLEMIAVLLTIAPYIIGVFYAMMDTYYDAKKKHTIDMAMLMAKAGAAVKSEQDSKAEGEH